MTPRILFTFLLAMIVSIFVTPVQPAFAANFTAADADTLVAAINAANATPDADTIILTGDIMLTAAADLNATYGDSGLPLISTDITIDGQGHRISRAADAPSFRIFRLVMTGNLYLLNLTVSGGGASACGSGITCGGGAMNEGGMLTIRHSLFTNNTSQRGGGVSNNANGTVVIIDSTFDSNTGTNNGGGIYNGAGILSITSSVLSNNSGGAGGGIAHLGGSLSTSDVTFSGNTAATSGGGIYSIGAGVINSTTFSGNSAATYGGGLYMDGVNLLYISNSTFTANSAAYNGGGLYSGGVGGGSIPLKSSTFLSNQPTAVSTATSVQTIHIDMQNSIVANTIGTGCTWYVYGGSTSLSDDPSCTGFIISDHINLGALADNGGATLTIPLNPDSSALDNARADVCPATDQRGIARGIDSVGGVNLPQTGDCDVGAFEFGGVIRTLQFAAPGSSVALGGISTYPVTLTLDSPLVSGSNITGYVWVSGGTAVAGTDYAPFGVQTATITPGNMTTTVTLNLLNPPTSGDKTIILSFATDHGPGLGGPARLGTQTTHTVTLTTTPDESASNRNFYSTHTPTLTWSNLTGETGYEIQVDTDDVFLAPYAFSDADIPVDGLSVTTTPLANGVYYWRVRAKNSAVWSKPERFEVFAVP